MQQTVNDLKHQAFHAPPLCRWSNACCALKAICSDIVQMFIAVSDDHLSKGISRYCLSMEGPLRGLVALRQLLASQRASIRQHCFAIVVPPAAPMYTVLHRLTPPPGRRDRCRQQTAIQTPPPLLSPPAPSIHPLGRHPTAAHDDFSRQTLAICTWPIYLYIYMGREGS